MMSRFISRESGQKLFILDYDERKTNVRYKTVINDNKLAVLHQHDVAIEDTPFDLLSLCPGVLENEVIEIIKKWSNSSLCLLFLIEKVEDTIVYRSRDCSLIFNKHESRDLCGSCSNLLCQINVEEDGKDVSDFVSIKDDGDSDDDDEIRYENYKTDKIDQDFNVNQTEVDPEAKTDLENDSDSNVPITPIVLPIMKRSLFKNNSTSGPEKKEEKKKHFPCLHCSEIFSSYRGMVKHANNKHNLRQTTPAQSELMECPFCDKMFRKYSPRWNVHLRYFHQQENQNPLYKEIIERIGVKKYICQLCGRDFQNNASLEHHMVTIHDSHLNTVTCEKCGKFFKNKDCLTSHLRMVHENAGRKFLCVECGKILKSKSDLENHIQRAHSNEKIICQECGKGVNCKKDLMRHIRKLHTDRKKTEKCSQCDKEFYNIKELTVHIISVHEKLKPWYCEVCDFKCSRLGNLNLHRKKSHSKHLITKKMILEMVENDQHPFYTKDDLPMIQKGPH